MKRFMTICALLGVTLALALSARPAAADTGEMAYRKKCSACHGKEGKGDTAMGTKLKAKDLSDPALQTELQDAMIEKFITDGIPEKKMPAQKDKLTAQEIKDVVKFVRTLRKKN